MTATESASLDLIDVASTVLPDADFGVARVALGQFHDVVLLPAVAVVRIARRAAAAAQLPRRMALLRRLGELGLPFAVSEVLSEVVVVGERAAVAVSWLAGQPLPRGEGDPQRLAALLAALREVSLDRVADVLDAPHAYAGRDAWLDLMLHEAIPRLPPRLRAEARRRTEEAAALAPVTPCLVHGDLGGDSIHWDVDGDLIGVLDWDLAQPFDQAVDAACLAWQGQRSGGRRRRDVPPSRGLVTNIRA